MVARRLFSMLLVAAALDAGVRPGRAADVPTLEVQGQVGGAPVDVAVAGDMAFLAVDERVVVVDVAQPARPSIAGQTPVLGTHVSQVAAHGTTVYAVVGRLEHDVGLAGLRGIAAIDASVPARPTLRSVLPLEHPPTRIVATSSHLYAVSGGDGMTVIDAADPSHLRVAGRLSPQLGGMLQLPATAVDVAVAGGHAVVVEERGRDTLDLLRVVDVSDPARPTAVGSVETGARPCGVALEWPNAYAWDSEGLLVVSLADPRAPMAVGRVEAKTSGACRLQARGSHVVLQAGSIRVFDVSAPAGARLASTVPTAGNLSSLALHGTHVLATNIDAGDDDLGPVHGLEIYDVSHAEAPRRVGVLDRDLWTAVGVTVVGEHAIVAAGGSGLRVVDVADRGRPLVVGSLNLGAQLTDVVVDDGLAYVADGSRGPALHIVDVRAPAAPVLLSTLRQLEGEAVGLVLAAGHAVLALRDGRVASVDVRDPAAPRVADTILLSQDITDIVAYMDTALVLSEAPKRDHALVVLDIGEPSSLTQLGSLSVDAAGPGAPGLAAADGYAYTSVGLSSLVTMDVRDPAVPVVAGRAPYAAVGTGFAAAGGFVIASGQLGLSLLDVTDGAAPVEAAFLPWPHLYLHARSNTVAVEGGCFVAAHFSAGLLTGCADLPARPTVVPATPTSSAATPTGTADPTIAPSPRPTGTPTPTPVLESTPTLAAPTGTPQPLYVPLAVRAPGDTV